tara:strand:+ start:1590 stop:1823 length:234 start_codon:yes stop_codon:yes gene_type:complete
MKYLKHLDKGTIYNWNEYLAEHPRIVEVSDEEAFPENFIPKAQRGRKSQVNLETKTIPEEPAIVFPELNADASRKLP